MTYFPFSNIFLNVKLTVRYGGYYAYIGTKLTFIQKRRKKRKENKHQSFSCLPNKPSGQTSPSLLSAHCSEPFYFEKFNFSREYLYNYINTRSECILNFTGNF
ncbi:hypothetical protein QUC31_001455 [Theobroma cacao]